jgi:hypothetical protein
MPVNPLNGLQQRPVAGTGKTQTRNRGKKAKNKSDSVQHASCTCFTFPISPFENFVLLTCMLLIFITDKSAIKS